MKATVKLRERVTSKDLDCSLEKFKSSSKGEEEKLSFYCSIWYHYNSQCPSQLPPILTSTKWPPPFDTAGDQALHHSLAPPPHMQFDVNHHKKVFIPSKHKQTTPSMKTQCQRTPALNFEDCKQRNVLNQRQHQSLRQTWGSHHHWRGEFFVPVVSVVLVPRSIPPRSLQHARYGR